MIQNIPAQSTVSQNTKTVFAIITLHTNPMFNATTSRTVSKPPLPLIQNTLLSFNLA